MRLLLPRPLDTKKLICTTYNRGSGASAMSTIITNYDCLPLSYLVLTRPLTVRVIIKRNWPVLLQCYPASLKLNLRFRSFPVTSSQIFHEHRCNSSCVSIYRSAIALHDDINLSIQKTKRLGDMTFGSHMVSNISLRPKLISL